MNFHELFCIYEAKIIKNANNLFNTTVFNATQSSFVQN
jgi:hypothetical protein